jgi:cytochrome c-type biogenesis protein CcmH/NrfF
MAFSRIEPYGFFIVMALVVSGLVSSLWMQPVMALTFGLVDLLLSPLSVLMH